MAGSSNWPCFPHRHKIKMSPRFIYQKSLPWNSRARASADIRWHIQFCWQALSCSALPITSVFGGSRSSSAHTGGAQRQRWARAALPGVAGCLSSSRHNQQQPFLFIPARKQGGDCARAGLHRAHDCCAISPTLPHSHAKKTWGLFLYNYSII